VIGSLAAQFPIRDLCEVLQVARSGYYRSLRRVACARERSNQQLLEQIRQAHQEARQTYGSPRITHQLRRDNIQCSENRVARLMRLHGIRAQQKRPFRPRTTDSRHTEAVAPNWLKQFPAPVAPDQVWTADITYIWTVAGWVYLAALMDLCSRKIVGWCIGQSLETNLVREALKQALLVRRPAPGLLHHSDRGCQYASSAYRALLQGSQLRPSMSAAGNCYDNAAMESFHSLLQKNVLNRRRWRTRAELRYEVIHWIEHTYNRQRRQRALGKLTPVEFELALTDRDDLAA